MLITLFGRLLLRRRLVAVLLALGAITANTLLVGANLPVVWTATIGGVAMFGLLLGCRQVRVNSQAGEDWVELTTPVLILTCPETCTI